MRRIGWLRGTMLLGGLLLGTTPSTQAGIVVESVIIEQIPNPVWEARFELRLDAGSEIRKDDYFTIYDLPGLELGSNNQPSAYWKADISNWPTPYLGVTPPGLTPADDPTIFNMTWKFLSTATITVPVGQSSIPLGVFSVTLNTSLDRVPTSLVYAWSITRPDGTKDIGTGTVPARVIPIPEPASVVLMGLGGLACLGWVRRRRIA